MDTVLDTFLAISRSVHAVLAKTYGQVSQMVMREFAELQRQLANPEYWRTPFGRSILESAWRSTAASAPPTAADTQHTDNRPRARKAA